MTPGWSDDPWIGTVQLVFRCGGVQIRSAIQLGFLAYRNMLSPRKVEFWVKDTRRLPGGTENPFGLCPAGLGLDSPGLKLITRAPYFVGSNVVTEIKIASVLNKCCAPGLRGRV